MFDVTTFWDKNKLTPAIKYLVDTLDKIDNKKINSKIMKKIGKINHHFEVLEQIKDKGDKEYFALILQKKITQDINNMSFEGIDDEKTNLIRSLLRNITSMKSKKYKNNS